MAQNPHRSRLKCAASPTRPGTAPVGAKTRPTPPLQQHFRERIHPALHKTPNLGHFERTGRSLSRSRPPSDQAGTTFSRTRRDNAEALKPTTPLLTPNKEPLKPASPLQPKNAPKTPVSHLQRRWRFQTHANTHEQRRHGFQTTEPPGRQGLAEGPSWSSRRGAEGIGGPGHGARGRWRGLAGLRDDAPSEARSADGSRAGRRPRAHQAARPVNTYKNAHPEPGGRI